MLPLVWCSRLISAALPVQVWGCSQEESNHIVHEFFKSHHFAVGVLPIPGEPSEAQIASLGTAQPVRQH